MKAAFFVKTLDGNPQYKAHKDFSLARQFGRRTTVVFRDGEVQNGYTLPEHSVYPCFFLFPVDPSSNNDKVYVIREATKEIRLVRDSDTAGQPRDAGEQPGKEGS